MTGQSEAARKEPNPISGEKSPPCATELKEEHHKHPYVDSAVEQTGRILKSLSQKVRSVADSLREESGPRQRVGKTVEKVANKLESSADYLSRGNPSALGEEISGVVKRYPMRTVGICLGVGLLIGAVMRRRGI
jgi:ElaB/YqjD/DUF883 family membrane-anchored ribosome-binding protein